MCSFWVSRRQCAAGYLGGACMSPATLPNPASMQVESPQRTLPPPRAYAAYDLGFSRRLMPRQQTRPPNSCRHRREIAVLGGPLVTSQSSNVVTSVLYRSMRYHGTGSP